MSEPVNLSPTFLKVPPLPPAMRCLSQVVYRIQSIFHCYGTARQLTENATHFGGVLGGFLLSCFCRNNKAVRLSAQTVLISLRAISAVKAQIIFAKNVWAFKNSFKIDENSPPVPQVSFHKWSFLPAGERERMSHSLNRIIGIIQSFFKYLIIIIKSLLKTNSEIRGLVRALKGEDDAIDEGVQDLCLNVCALTDECTSLVDELCRHEREIHGMLRSLGATHRTDLVSRRIGTGCQMGGAAIAWPLRTIGKGVKAAVIGFKEPKRLPSHAPSEQLRYEIMPKLLQ